MPASSRTSAPLHWRFPLLVALLLGAVLALFPPVYGGDAAEYAVTAVAIADHGTPAIRLDDIERVHVLLNGALDGPLNLLAKDMRAAVPEVFPAFVRGRAGDVFSIHFFGYPLLAAVPFKLFKSLGIPPFKAFQAVNLLAVFALALALRRFFASELKAWIGLGLFMLCGGVLYLHWTSTECLSAAALLAGLLFFTSGAPVAGGLLAGLAGQQNPTIVFFFVFAPLFKLWFDYDRALGLAQNLRAVLDRRTVLGLAAGMALFALPPLFNLWQYGVPNIIARRFSDPSLIGAERLTSFFFDLSQGMVVGIPAVMLALLLLLSRGGRRDTAGMLLLSLAFVLALAVPALAVLNWNSGAAGVMRYAFWAGMCPLFALLALLRRHPRWPRLLVAGVLALQAGAMAHASRYAYVEFSPAARLALAHAPGLYHPEPEIFAERAGHHDDYIRIGRIYAFKEGGTIKTLASIANAHAEEQLCGSGREPVPGLPQVASTRGWYFIDGPIRCQAAGFTQRSFAYTDMGPGGALALVNGWSTPVTQGEDWDGVWSLGARSQIRISAPTGLGRQLYIIGNYIDQNRGTRVLVNGVDLGRHVLGRIGPLALPDTLRAATLDITLVHESPRALNAADPRPHAFFLREVIVRQPLATP